MNRFAKLTAALALVIAAATGAAAADGCLDAGGYRFVSKGFKKPSPGKCKPFMGFAANGYPGDTGVTGSACASKDGTHVDFTLTHLERNNGEITTRQHLVVIEFPNGEGSDYWNLPEYKSHGISYAAFFPCSGYEMP